MKTLVTETAEEAAAFIRAGQIAAFPTETVYGLGADALRPEAVAQIFEAKGRPSDNPLIVHLVDEAQIADVANEIPSFAWTFIDRFFPGPLTIVLRKADRIPEIVTAGLDTVAIRMPAHEAARAFLTACGTPVAAPSANRSGRPSPTTWQAVLEDLDGIIPCILKGERTDVGLESTVVDCTLDVPIVLRTGAVTLEALRDVVPSVRPRRAGDDEAVRSPGLRHRHYSPRAAVRLTASPPTDPPSLSGFIGLSSPIDPSSFARIRVCENVAEYAYELFEFFRKCDAAGLATIFCEMPPDDGLGAAIADRLRRAAEPNA